ncbi:uncharacterized protein LOC100368834 isoform X2 [Saccoglossus kowalevskii]|uniref:Uncharacterized protein PFB0765w-like isoform X1 n=2 Tax=Saccoglossus kowalevskii TaxID=10224 RepID=A0ABM0GPY9_SACKO|nr:PREDICTED: uncharacterized protein PFB0765w-like isoform X1 [Saccoglossus kowalevskii]
MATEKKRILSENLDYLAKTINVDQVVKKTEEMYPSFLNNGDVVALNVRKREARALHLLDIFKEKKDGYDKLYKILKATNHSTTVLKTLEPGVDSKQPAASPLPKTQEKSLDKDQALILAMKEMMEMSNQRMVAEMKAGQREMSDQLVTFKDNIICEITGLREAMDRIANLEDSMKIETSSREDLRKIIQALVQEFTTFKEEYRKTVDKLNKLEKQGSYDEAKLNNFIDKLNNFGTHGEEKLWKEIEKLREELVSLRKWTEDNCGKMQKRLECIEEDQKGRPRGHPIVKSDIQYIAVKIGTYWEVVAKEVGIQKDTIAKTGGESAMSASLMMSRWLELSNSGGVAPPTWESLQEIMRRHDSRVASEIDELRKLTEK